MPDFEIRIDGLKRSAAVYRAIDKELHANLRRELNVIARVVATEAKSRVPRRSGRLAGSIRPSSTPIEGRVSMGTARVPYAGFIEFGGRVGVKKSVRRPFVKKGRYLWPALDANRPVIVAAADGLVKRAVKQGGG